MPLYIYSYNPHSEGALLLKEELGIQRIRNEGSRFRGRPDRTVINWGSSNLPQEVERCRVLNSARNVSSASNKLSFFRKISQGNRGILPPWTENFNQAVAWTAENKTVCARTILNGHSANGLVLMDRARPQEFVRAPLYTQYIVKDEEYRVHVNNNEVVDIQRKVLGPEKRQRAEQTGEEINWKIRNLDNGFIYQRNNLNPPEIVQTVALEAMRLSELDFGAVDVIYKARNVRTPVAYVLEINTAPGITGTTVENYARVFRRYQ